MATKQTRTEQPRIYEQISPKAYEHPADKAATSALHAVPLLDKVIKKLTDLGYERRYRQILMGNAVRLGHDQLPATYELFLQSVRSLDLPETPSLFVTNSPFVNAMAVGANAPMVVVHSSLVGDYTEAEIQSVLAHEAGHVLSEHMYYTTALLLLQLIMLGALPRSLVIGLPIRALYAALLEWSRAAELSSDRAAALVMGDPLDPCRMLMRLAGGSVPGMDFDAFVRQCTEYVGEEDIFSRYSRFWVEIGVTHPFPVRRVRELVAWVHAGDFDRIRSGEYPRRGHEPPPSAEFNDAVNHYRVRFAYFLERTTNDVQRLTNQFGDWLKRMSGSNGEAPTDDDLADDVAEGEFIDDDFGGAPGGAFDDGDPGGR